MTSILEVEQLDTLSSNASSTLTIGGTNTTTIAFGPNVTTTPSSLANTPAFEAYLSSAQTLSSAVDAKVQFDTEVFDTNSNYDNSTNYRFTPTVAGKYFVYASMYLSSGGNTMVYSLAQIYKNGSLYRWATMDPADNQIKNASVDISGTLDMNGSTDYVEIYARLQVSSGSPSISASPQATYFGAYKLIGA